MNDRFRPKNQADCDYANALREYEAAHKVWLDTSVFTDAGKRAKSTMDVAREKLIAARSTAQAASRTPFV